MPTSSEIKDCKKNKTDILKDKRFLHNHTICAHSPNDRAKDSCMGDSGGPLACGPPTKIFLMGVLSYGSENCGGTPSDPGVYISVPWFRDWIKKHKGT